MDQESQPGPSSRAEAAERLLKANPESGLAYFLLGQARNAAGDLAEAESLLWRAVDLTPCDYPVYMSLSQIRSDRDPDDPVAVRLRTLAIWKLGLSGEIPENVAMVFGSKSPLLDAHDPETFRLLASTLEHAFGPAPPEVEERLRPYRLLNALQIQAPDAVSDDLVREIRDNSTRCLPLFRASLREWGRTPRILTTNALALIVAWVGEIGGVEVLDELIELVVFPDDLISLHAHWAVWRVGQRFPDETLSRLRAATPGAPVALRCALAEQFNLLPDVEGIVPALADLVEGFSDFASNDQAPDLLMTVMYALRELSHEGEAERVFEAHHRSLPKKGREELQYYIDLEDGFVPKLMADEIDVADIEDVCLRRVLLADFGEDDDRVVDDYEHEDEPPPIPQARRVKPDRNGPCWCGSGKKYKKCHLAADEEAERTRRQPAAAQPRPDSFFPTMLGGLLDSVPQVRSRAEMREAHRLYFDSAIEGKFREPGSENFTEWAIFDFRPGGTGRTVVEEYVRRRPRLPERERALLESWKASRFGIVEVQRIERGSGVEVKDVLAGDLFFVHDVSLSKSSALGDCILTRIQQFEERWIFTAGGLTVSRAVLPLLLSRVEEECGATGPRAAEYIRANSHRLHRVLAELHKQQ